MADTTTLHDKKYLAGRLQSNGQFIFVAEIHPGIVIETTIEDNAIPSETIAGAQNLAAVATFSGEHEYGVIQVEKTTTELSEE